MEDWKLQGGGRGRRAEDGRWKVEGGGRRADLFLK